MVKVHRKLSGGKRVLLFCGGLFFLIASLAVGLEADAGTAFVAFICSIGGFFSMITAIRGYETT